MWRFSLNLTRWQIPKNLRPIMELLEVATCCTAVVFTDATSSSIILGGVIAIVGALLFTWAGGFQRMEREGVLTLGGPYRFVRHPWILARFLMVFGIILMARLPVLFLIAMVGLTPLYRRLTKMEDQYLYTQLGPLAAEYRAFVAGFMPQFSPAKLPSYGRGGVEVHFSWRRALWKRPGRGWLAILGVGVTVLVMAVWLEQWAPVWVFRLVTSLVAVAAIYWLIKDRAQYKRRGFVEV
jgi:protein-S-isoprenylcysteine O-methyltransferase Ste14